jgi:hypothetical protein
VQRELAVLEVWEAAAGAAPLARDDALLRSAGADAPQGLGARNAALLATRMQLFGPRWPLRSRCPACGSDCGFEADCSVLLPQLDGGDAAAAATHTLRVGEREIRFRLPLADDLRETARAPDAASASRALLRRCVQGEAAEDLSEDAQDALSARMDALDPGAHIGFALACPDCGHAWHAPVDVGDALWSEVQAAAERTLLDIDALARAYGWSEPQVLALSPTRRAAYLQLVGAA